MNIKYIPYIYIESERELISGNIGSMYLHTY